MSGNYLHYCMFQKDNFHMSHIFLHSRQLEVNKLEEKENNVLLSFDSNLVGMILSTYN